MVSRAPDATQHVWRHLAGRLMQLLHDWLPDVQEPVLREVAGRLERVALPGGQTLLRQGEPGDALYLWCRAVCAPMCSMTPAPSAQCATWAAAS